MAQPLPRYRQHPGNLVLPQTSLDSGRSQSPDKRTIAWTIYCFFHWSSVLWFPKLTLTCLHHAREARGVSNPISCQPYAIVATIRFDRQLQIYRHMAACARFPARFTPNGHITCALGMRMTGISHIMRYILCDFSSHTYPAIAAHSWPPGRFGLRRRHGVSG